MKKDFKGCSTCSPGQEQIDSYYIGSTLYVQYDYRSIETQDLFTGVYASIEKAREARDKWLAAKGLEQ